ncbi:KptA family-domain-containing protein [Thelonectria olida]|uniref:2'-phosphotransferase n=1 Tax=Thelonectria olida TaxID=1576542 RepID=A0A9P8WDQ9_9HYPO|nr:KptA family-domain-containing protein [Thelonectria olida]
MADDLDAASQYEALEDRVLGKAPRGGRRGRGGRGGGGGGGGQSREVQISKALSKLLRHQAEAANIKLDGEGYAPLDRVLAWGSLKSQKVTLEEIQAAVTSSDKQRFSLKPNPETNPSLSTTSVNPADYLIRANQGHSIKLDSAAHLEAITLADANVPPRVLHGTYFYFWPKIVESGGLKSMGRNHVHCSTGTPEEGVVSGMRRDAELVIEVDVEASLHDGVKWWRSDNGVLLTEGDEQGGGLSSRYFKKVTGRQRDVGVLWQDGEWRADLPTGLKLRPPPGKGGTGGGRGGRGGRRGG